MARVRGAEGFSATLGPDSHRGFRRKRTEQDQASPGVATELCPGNRHDKGTPDPCLKWDFQVYLRNDGAVLNIDLDRCWQASPLRDTNKSRVAHKTFTLTTRPLMLTLHA